MACHKRHLQVEFPVLVIRYQLVLMLFGLLSCVAIIRTVHAFKYMWMQ